MPKSAQETVPGRARLGLLILICLMLGTSAHAELPLPDRRKAQFHQDQGHYLFPSPYSIPGLGSGLLVAGALVNIAQSYTDLYGFATAGDIEGIGILLTGMHLIDQRLIVDLSATRFSKATSQVYPARGMDTQADDYVLAELDRNDFSGARLTYTLYDRRLEFFALTYQSETRLAAIRDKDGDLVQFASDGDSDSSRSYSLGFRLDLTDDYTDPRQGFRLETSLWHSPTSNHDSPDYNVIELNLTGYIPLRQSDTLVINYFEAATDVRRRGETDPAMIEAQLGINCDLLSEQLRSDCNSVVNDRVAQNAYGSVSSLGGLSRLRAFPEDRFKGSRAIFYGLEYRWNLLEESRPFDIWIARDVRSVIQLAAFFESGAIADQRRDLSGSRRDVWGLGARLVTQSGLVFRADLASGDEGEEISIIFGYPWEIF